MGLGNADLIGAGSSQIAVGWSGELKIDESATEIGNKIKVGEQETREKNGKSDIWNIFFL